MPHLQAINLSKSYRNKSALIDCSFSASDGELIGILGANGAGKSTLIKILAGVLKPEAGDAILNGHSILNERREAQGKIGYLPEVTGGFDDITVYEFLSFSANAYGIGNQPGECDKWIRHSRIAGREHKYNTSVK